MKHWLSLVAVPEVEQFVEVARFAEELGFHGITVADHLVMPTQITKSRYPYTPDGKMWWPDETPWPDPWVTITAMGVATRKIEFATNIYLAALRDPFTAARAVAAASVYTGGRIACGVSAGWIEEEYEMLGLDFHSRGRRLDETVTVLRKLWSGESVSHHGEFFNFDHALMSPKPVQPVPVWSGGASKAALKRAANNDGWLAVPMTAAQLEKTVLYLHSLRKENGKENEHFEVCGSLLEHLTPERQERLESIGVQGIGTAPWIITPWGRAPWLKENEDPSELDVKKKAMERYAAYFFKR
jgi:probable F420-dependent oxidoreductase